MQALQPCSDTHCECEKRFTSPVSSCKQHTLQAAPCQVNKNNHVLKQKTGRFCRKIRHLRRSIMQALQPCSDTHCECEKRFTSPVSSCKQHTLQAAPHVKSTKTIRFSPRLSQNPTGEVKQTCSQLENQPFLSQNQTSKEINCEFWMVPFFPTSVVAVDLHLGDF